LPVGLQVSSAHRVPTGQFWQPPPPSHLPLVLQVACGFVSHIWRGSALPAAAIVHFPIVASSLQLRQAPVQAESQQTPSTQNPCWHSLDVRQL
jgi:hypothetical protein